MTIDNKIKREAEKISAVLLVKIDKSEYLMGEEKSPPGLGQIMQQAKFTYFPLGNAFEK